MVETNLDLWNWPELIDSGRIIISGSGPTDPSQWTDFELGFDSNWASSAEYRALDMGRPQTE